MGVSSGFRVISRALLGVMVAGAFAPSLQAQEAKTILAMPPTPLLPESLRTGPDHDAGNGAPSWSGADGPILVEDGIRRYERGTAESAVAHGSAGRGGQSVTHAAQAQAGTQSTDRTILIRAFSD